MNDQNSEMVYSLDASRKMLHFFVGGLTPEERLFRACPGANCVDWIIGHLVLTERQFHQRIGASSPPIPEGFEKTFARDESAPGMTEYGDTSNLMQLFDSHRNETIEAVKRLSKDQLAAPLEKPHRLFSTVAEAIGFCSIHQMMHAGQITMIRRALGKPPLI